MTRQSNSATGPPLNVLAEFAEKYQGPPAQVEALERLERMLELARADEAAARRLAREWALRDPHELVSAVVQAAKRSGGDAERAWLRPFVSADALAAALLKPGWYSDEDARKLVQELASWAPDLDLHIARRAFGDEVECERPIPSLSLQRALALLEELAPGERILPFLSRACRRGDERVRSVVPRLAVRYRARGLLAQLLEDGNPRVRANAVESLASASHWGDREVLLWRAAGDEHHRVAVNALVALARLGDPEALERLETLAEHPQPEFRAAAAWGMGELGDPRFDSTLNRLRQDEAGIVRRNALRALVRLRKARARGPVNGKSGA